MLRLLPLLIFLSLFVACGVSQQAEVADPEFNEVRQHAFDALSQPGSVFHTTEKVSRDGEYQRTDEVWLDLDNDVARVSVGGRLRIFHDDKIAELGSGNRLQDAGIWESDVEKTSALALGYITQLFSVQIQGSRSRALENEGSEALRLDVETPWRGDWTGTNKFEIYLDRHYLPVRVVDKVEGAGPEDRTVETNISYDFIPRSDLPPDFLSVEAVSSLAETPADFLLQALTQGLQPYWLGESFEGLTLTDVRLGQSPDVELEYTENGSGESGQEPVGVVVYVFVRQPATFCDGIPSATTSDVSLSGKPASICEADGASVGLEGDKYLELLVPFDDAEVTVMPLWGAPGKNPYNDVENLVRLGASLRPFEPPP